MLNNIKKLLQNKQLQEKIKAAKNQAVVIELLLIAGAEKGYTFNTNEITQLLIELNITSHELSEDDLLGVIGGVTKGTIKVSFRWCIN
jgi:hypothetical protein